MRRSENLSRLLGGVCIAVSLTLTGCANGPLAILTTEPQPGWTQEQVELLELSKESAEIQLAATGVASAFGFGISLLICEDVACHVATTRDFALLGYAGGAYVASKRELASEEQTELRSSLSGARGAVAFYEKRVDIAQAVVSQHEREVAALNQQNLAHQANRAAYEMQVEELRGDRARIASFADQTAGDIDFMSKEIELREDGGQSVAALKGQRRVLEDINARLQAQLEKLDRVYEGVPEAVGTV